VEASKQLASVYDRHEYQVIPLGQQGINLSMCSVDQNDAEMLLWEVEVIDNILNICGGGIIALALLEPTRLEEAD
jgi:hypothetical protein